MTAGQGSHSECDPCARPVQAHGLAVLLQGAGISEVFILVEAGLRYMKDQGLKREQYTRLKSHRDILAEAHDERMSTNGHDLPVYVVREAHSVRQDVADLITVADAAAELGYTERHVRRLAHAGLLQRGGIPGLLIRSDVLTLAARRRKATTWQSATHTQGCGTPKPCSPTSPPSASHPRAS